MKRLTRTDNRIGWQPLKSPARMESRSWHRTPAREVERSIGVVIHRSTVPDRIKSQRRLAEAVVYRVNTSRIESTSLFHNRDTTTDSPDGEADLARHHTHSRGGWHTGLILFLISAVLCVVSAEVTARAFWHLRHGVPFRDPSRILYAYYPELRSVDTERPAQGDAFFDILFLGGSVLHRHWGQVEQALREQMAYNGHRNIRIFNLAMPAHTSRDSRLKYAALGEARFELVLFYHGINEARVNNAPPEIFREDYAHYSWYESVNTLASYHGTASFALPYTLHFLAIRMWHALTKDRYVPTHSPRADWVQHGRIPRSALSFEHNLDAILDLATLRGDRALLMTFATHVPDDYSLEAFKDERLGYGLHLSPIEMWGAPEHVLKAVAVHNDIVRSIAAQRKEFLFVDQASLMAGSPRYFNDLCHFTVIGSSQFVEYLLRVLLPSLQSG